MNKNLILYIAYRTTENLVDPKRGRFNHFGRAKVFIAMAIALNIIEVILIVNALFFQKRLFLKGEAFLLLYLFPLVVYFFINLIFKKSTLAKAIKLYKESNFAMYGRSIGLLYLFLNFIIVVLLIAEMRHFND